MYVVGISALDKDSSVTLFENDRPVYSVTEERLTRVKQQDGFPWRAFEEMLEVTGLTPERIDVVAYPFFSASGELTRALRHAPRIVRQVFGASGLPVQARLSSVFDYPASLRGNYEIHAACDAHLRRGIAHYKLQDRLRRYPHELCHAAAAFYSSGYDRALIQISDWYGSGSSGGVYLGDGDRLELLVEYAWPNSLGSYYARYTQALGFTADKDEGKILGLAAYGDPARLYHDFLAEFTLRPDGSFEHSRCLDSSNLPEIVERYDREDIAAALQRTFETVLLHSLAVMLARYGPSDVCLAGGSMANVKLNQRIRELPGARDVYVFPAMADVGSGYGAACLALAERGVCPRHHLDHLYLSKQHTRDDVVRALDEAGVRYTHCSDIEADISRLLAANHIVGRWAGAMEFGPRALGNRSILANPSDRTVNERLNAMLQRTEFMPFAPSVLADYAIPEFFEGIDRGLKSAANMTMTFNVTEVFAGDIPAAVHIDGTARIQAVSQATNPSFYKIIQCFHELTGIPAVINTSFNMHGEPIVYSPADAIRTFKAAGLEYVALDDFLVVRDQTD